MQLNESFSLLTALSTAKKASRHDGGRKETRSKEDSHKNSSVRHPRDGSVLEEYLGLVPSTHRVAHNCVIKGIRGSGTLV